MSLLSFDEIPLPALPGDEFLTFQLGASEYGIDILKVQEIRACDRLDILPGAPAHVAGSLDLRGMTVPVIDLRHKLALEAVRDDPSTAVIILSVAKRVLGVVVDGVLDVTEIDRQQIESPATAQALEAACVIGIARVGAREIILTDVERWLAGDDLSEAQAA